MADRVLLRDRDGAAPLRETLRRLRDLMDRTVITPELRQAEERLLQQIAIYDWRSDG